MDHTVPCFPSKVQQILVGYRRRNVSYNDLVLFSSSSWLSVPPCVPLKSAKATHSSFRPPYAHSPPSYVHPLQSCKRFLCVTRILILYKAEEVLHVDVVYRAILLEYVNQLLLCDGILF